MGRRARRRRRTLSLAARKRMSAARRGKKHPHRGVHPSAAARAHESAAHRGKRHPHKGHRMSAATRAKLSRALKGRHHKTRCHCGGTRPTHSLKRRRAAHAQKHHTVKRNKVHGRGKLGINSTSASRGSAAFLGKTVSRGKLGINTTSARGGPGAFTGKKSPKTGKCHCPKTTKAAHARRKRTAARKTAHSTRKHR